jgi:hypothetical protein
MAEDHLVNVSHLRQALGITWHIMRKYQRIGLISDPAAYVSGRPHWHISAVEIIQERINQYKRNRLAAAHNAPLSLSR